MLIAGHTHRPMFAEDGAPLYFNTGSAVHPRCITALEINYGQIQLVKWFINTRLDGTLFIDRKILAGPLILKEALGNLIKIPISCCLEHYNCNIIAKDTKGIIYKLSIKYVIIFLPWLLF